MDLWVSKLITAIVLLVLTLLFSFIPYVTVLRGNKSLVSARLRDRIIAYMNCLAGGVFMGALLVHILVEGDEQFEDYKKAAGVDIAFPLFNVFVAIGFFLIAFVELMAKTYLGRNEQSYNTLEEDPSPGQTGNTSGDADGKHVMANIENSKSKAETEPTQGFSHGHSHGGASLGGDSQKPVSIRAFLLLIALSFHTIFDGLAVGLQTDTAEVWSVFAAIAIHKSVIAFCLGLELFQNNPEKPIWAIVWLFVFSLMSPLGIGIGVGLTTGTVNNAGKLLAASMLQGIAGGTFMYVTFLEIMSLYIGHHAKGSVIYILFAIVGFAIMASVKLLDTD